MERSFTREKLAHSSASKMMRRKSLQGFECGLGIENYNDLKVGDID
jgi:hypothetical protein